MRRTPTISVITIFFNEERFLAEAVESVLAQTCTDWELLLCDDGSTDRSLVIARDFAERHPDRIRLLHHEGHANLGMSATRNLGLRHSRGEFIALLDADDVWLPQKLESQLELFRTRPNVGMVCSPTRFWYSWTGRPEDAQLDAWRRLAVKTDAEYHPPSMLVRLLQNRIVAPATCSVLMRRRAVEAAGGFEDRFRDLYEDQAFFAKLFLTAPVYVGSGSWDLYRQHPDSTCYDAERAGTYNNAMPHRPHLDFLLWLEQHLDSVDEPGRRVRAALQRELWLYRHPRLHRLVRRTSSLPDRAAGIVWQRAVPLGFRLGRLLLPAPVRRWLWQRWQVRRTAVQR